MVLITFQLFILIGDHTANAGDKFNCTDASNLNSVHLPDSPIAGNLTKPIDCYGVCAGSGFELGILIGNPGLCLCGSQRNSKDSG